MNIFTVSGDLLRVSASVALVLDLRSSQSAAGLSRRAMELMLLATVFKYLDMLVFFVGVYNWGMKAAFIALAAYPAYLLRTGKSYKSSYDSHLDTFPTAQVLLPCLLLSLFLHPALNVVDVLYSFSVWLEVAALLPQLSLSQKTAEHRDGVKQWAGLWALSRGMYAISFLSRLVSDSGSVNWIATLGAVGQVAVAVKLALVVIRKKEKTEGKSE